MKNSSIREEIKSTTYFSHAVIARKENEYYKQNKNETPENQ